MSRQAVVGLFTIIALLALFGIFLVLENIGTQGRYQVGIHFKSAAGLHKGALVYESGVVVGVVDQTVLQPDFTVEVILAINNSVDVPRDARFLIQAPLTGDSSLEIVPVSTERVVAANVLPRQVLPIDQQPTGTNPATLQDLLDQGQGEVHRLDAMLAELETREPKLLNTLQSALDNANQVAVTTNHTFGKLSARIDSLTDTLQLALQQGSANITDMTSQLDQAVHRNTGHFDSIALALDNSARDLNRTADRIQQLAADPKLHDDILQTTHGLAQTATTFASLAADLRTVTSNPQTQAQLRDTIASADAAMQKADSLLGKLGGTSSVYGIDAGATPAPHGAGASGAAPVPGTSPAPHGASPQALKFKVGDLVHQLIALQVRVSELDAEEVGSNSSPLLTKDRGPSTDVNAILFPHGSTYLYTGVNDVGGPSATANVAAMTHVSSHLLFGGGLLYSRLGMRADYDPGSSGVGVEGLVYDPRHPTADGYLNLKLGGGLELFGGERDILHTGRRTTFGLQYQF
ncbi:MAG TPA: MlaD family protein [Candidatus Sulfotelmatobacter sp.]|nr:MlaD family protein [Candidatus Sulfotelmatobacter sp.]